jgi:hypothetical protein
MKGIAMELWNSVVCGGYSERMGKKKKSGEAEQSDVNNSHTFNKFSLLFLLYFSSYLWG